MSIEQPLALLRSYALTLLRVQVYLCAAVFNGRQNKKEKLSVRTDACVRQIKENCIQAINCEAVFNGR